MTLPEPEEAMKHVLSGVVAVSLPEPEEAIIHVLSVVVEGWYAFGMRMLVRSSAFGNRVVAF